MTFYQRSLIKKDVPKDRFLLLKKFKKSIQPNLFGQMLFKLVLITTLITLTRKRSFISKREMMSGSLTYLKFAIYSIQDPLTRVTLVISFSTKLVTQKVLFNARPASVTLIASDQIDMVQTNVLTEWLRTTNFLAMGMHVSVCSASTVSPSKTFMA